MLVRQLERKWAESEAVQSNVQLMRSLACYEEAFLFLDTSREGDWRVLHMNMAASTALGGYLPAAIWLLIYCLKMLSCYFLFEFYAVHCPLRVGLVVS